jgi:hypothetical protein
VSVPPVFAEGPLVSARPLSAKRSRLARSDALTRAFTWVTVLVPIALWIISLPAIDLTRLGSYGLSTSLPPTWYAALAILLIGAVRATFAKRFDGVLAAAHVVVAVLIVYATIPAVAALPQYAWTYNHIGVTESIAQAGSIFPIVDIYHRWPGFFALAAAFSRLTGVANPTNYAAWAEPVFTLLAALVVAAITRLVSRDGRVAVVASMLFVLSGWVAQNYFAPQSLAYVLALVVMLIVVTQLRTRKWPQRLIARVGAEPVEPAELGWSRRTTLAVVAGLFAAIVVTHQLTPYMILLSLTVLAVFGVLRPRWLIAPAAALAIAYLVPQITYLTRNFSLFHSVAAKINPYGPTPAGTNEPWLVAHAGGLVSGCMCVAALFALVVLVRRRSGPVPLVVLTVAISPALTLLGLSYGGETAQRVHYFALPWLAVLAAWGLVALRSAGWQRLVTAVTLAAVTVFFVVAFFGRTELNVIPPDEVQASAYFYDHAQPKSLLVLVSPDFPMRSSARYTVMAYPDGSDSSPQLMSRENAPLVRDGSLGAVLTTLRQLAGSNTAPRYLVFSQTEARYANANRILSFAQTRRLEGEVAGSPDFRLWYQNPDSSIYEESTP